MALVFAVGGALVVFAIAAAFIGRETGRLDAESPRPVFDVDEAVTWVADRLPDNVTAQLTHAELRRILLCSVDHLRLLAFEERVASEDESVAHVGSIVDLPERAVRASLRTLAEYLQVIGATGPISSSPPERGGGPTAQSL